MLRHPAPVSRLLEELERFERLVLLGDAVELMEGRPARAMEVARPVLRRIGEAMRGREVVVVSGNHDAPLTRRWARRHAETLTEATEVPADASLELTELTGLLAAAEVRVFHPGVWVGDSVWASHGHYLNRHLLPRNAVGLPRAWLGRSLPPLSVSQYERPRRRPVRDAEGVTARVADLSERLARATTRTVIGVPRAALRPALAPLTSRMLALQFELAAMPAMARVVGDLRVEAGRIIFGHTHRLGPLGGEDASRWATGMPGQQLLNTGSWLLEPLLASHAAPPHPYWPGGAVVVEDGADPRAVSLLDGLSVAELRGG